MTFDPARLVRASFNGIPFWVATGEAESGHRVATTHVPGGEHVNESFGPKARQWTIDAYVVGDAYIATAASLEAAVSQEHVGTLVLPDAAPVLVRLTRVKRRFDRDKLGYSALSIEAIAEPAAAPPLTLNALFAAGMASADALPALMGAFLAATLSFPADFPALANDAIAEGARAQGWLIGMGEALRLDSQAEATLAWQAASEQAIAALETLPADPAAFGQAFGEAALALGDAAPALDLSGLVRALGVPPVAAPLPGGSAYAAAAAENTAAVDALIATATVLTLGRADLQRVPGSRDEDIEARSIAEQAFATALARVGRKGLDLVAGLQVLRSDLFALVTARSGSLAPVLSVRVDRPLPAQVLAHGIYGTSVRADDLARRAQAPHPGFMPLEFTAEGSALMPFELVTLSAAGLSLVPVKISLRASMEEASRSFEASLKSPSLGMAELLAALSGSPPCTIRARGSDGIALGDALAGGDLLLTGYVEKRSPRISGDEQELTISGRSKTSDLVDSAHDHASGEFRQKSTTAIARDLSRPFGVEVQDDAGATGTRDVHRLRPGETVFRSIERLARTAGVSVTDTAEGKLRLAKAGRQRHAGQIVPGGRSPSYSDISAVHDDSGRSSKVVVRAQSPKGFADSDLRIEAEALDNGQGDRRRLRVIVPPEALTRAEARQRARWHRDRAVGKGITVEVTVDGWRDPAGRPWTPGWLLYVEHPSLGLAQDMMIESVTYKQDGEGQRPTQADLSLVDPRAYGGKAAKSSRSSKAWNPGKIGADDDDGD